MSWDRVVLRQRVPLSPQGSERSGSESRALRAGDRHKVLALQRAIGNRAVVGLLQRVRATTTAKGRVHAFKTASIRALSSRRSLS